MSRIKRAIEIIEETSEFDVPVWRWTNDPYTRKLDEEIEEAQRRWELSKFTRQELDDEILRRIGLKD